MRAFISLPLLLLCWFQVHCALLSGEDSPYVIHDLITEIWDQVPEVSDWNNVYVHQYSMDADGIVYLVVTDGGRFWDDGHEQNEEPTEIALLGRDYSGHWDNRGWPDEMEEGRFALANILESGEDWYGVHVDLVAGRSGPVLVFFDGGSGFPTVVPHDGDWAFGNVLLGEPDVPMTIWGGDWGAPLLAGMRWDDPIRGILVETSEEGAGLINVSLDYDESLYGAFADHGFVIDSVSRHEGVDYIAGFIVAGTFFDGDDLLPEIEPDAFDHFFAVLDGSHSGVALIPELPETVSWEVDGTTVTAGSDDFEVDYVFAVPQGLVLVIEYENGDDDLLASFLYPLDNEGQLGDPVRLGEDLDIEVRGVTSVGTLYGVYTPHDDSGIERTGVIIDISDPQDPQLSFGQTLLPEGLQEWRTFMSGTEDGSVILANWGRELVVERAEVSISADDGTTLVQDGEPITVTLERHDTAMLGLKVNLHVPDGVSLDTTPDWLGSVGSNVYEIVFPSSWLNPDGKTRTIALSYESGAGTRDITIQPPPAEWAWSAMYGYRPKTGDDTVTVTLEAIEPTPVLSVEQEFTNQSPVEVTITFSEPVYGFDPAAPGKLDLVNATVASHDVPDGLFESWTFEISPEEEGSVSVQVLAGATTNAGDIASVASNVLTFVYDTTPPPQPTPPMLEDASDSGTKGDGVTNVTQPEIIGTVEEHATAILLIGETQEEVVAGADGHYSFTFSDPLADGEYILRVRARDRAGNISEEWSDPFMLTIKTSTVTPTLALHPDSDSGQRDDDGITNVTEPTVRGTAETGASLSLLVVETGDQYPVPNVVEGTWSLDLNEFAADGDYTLRATATDLAANSAQAEITITIDTEQPTLSHAADGSLTDEHPSFTLVASEALYGLVAGVLTMEDADAQPVAFSVSSGEDGDTEFVVTATEAPSVAGLVTLTVVSPGDVTDLAGNELAAPLAFTLIYDADPVELVITPDDAERTNTNETTVTFTFSETVEGFDASDVTVVNAVAGTLENTDVVDDLHAVFTMTIDLSASDDGPVTVSVAAAAATAVDGGNLSREASAVVATVDRSGPVLTAQLITITGQAPQGTEALDLIDGGGLGYVLTGPESLDYNDETRVFTVIVEASREVLRLRASSAADPDGSVIIVTIDALTELLEDPN